MKELDMKEVAKMKKIETLEIIFGGWGDRVPLDDNGSEDHDGEGLKDKEAFRTLVESLVQMTTFISRIFLKSVEVCTV